MNFQYPIIGPVFIAVSLRNYPLILKMGDSCIKYNTLDYKGIRYIQLYTSVARADEYYPEVFVFCNQPFKILTYRAISDTLVIRANRVSTLTITGTAKNIVIIDPPIKCVIATDRCLEHLVLFRIDGQVVATNVVLMNDLAPKIMIQNGDQITTK